MSNSTPLSTWLLHFRLYINGQKVTWPELYLDFASGEVFEVKLEYEHSTFIGLFEGALALFCEPGADETGMISDPPFEALVEMEKGTISKTWIIDTRQMASCDFKMYFKMPRYTVMPDSPVITGEVINFQQEVSVRFDTFAMDFGISEAHPCHGATHALAVVPLATSKLLNKYVYVITDAQVHGVGVTPKSSQLLTDEGISFQLDCSKTTKDSKFSIQLGLDHSSAMSPVLQMSLGHNLVTARYWRKEQYSHPDITWYSHHVLATSVFLNTFAPGVRVTIKFNGSTSYRDTDSNGEAQVNDQMNMGVKLSILNGYDNTIV